ncbi:MAG: carbohydrate ABC transporter permease [Clostridia bacterium]|nr:carbohydrate ABC transporter permease [Clostridia bacterium]
MTKFNKLKQFTLSGRESSLSVYKVRKKTVSLISSIARYVFLIAFSYTLLYPILFMISHAIRDPMFFNDPTVQWIPKAYTFSNFQSAWVVLQMPTSLFNTITVEVISSLISIIACGVAAYGLACFKFRGQGILNALLILLILVPFSMTLIPNFVNYYNFDFLGLFTLIEKIFKVEIDTNLLDTLWAVYLPSITAVGLKSGLCIYIYRQFYRALPKELFEAAWIDGAGPLLTYVRIVVPSSGVALLTVSLLSIIWHWNDYYIAQMFLTNHRTMAVELNDFFMHHGLDGVVVSADSCMAACLMFVTPMLVFYLILQKRFIASISATGIVG